MTPERSPATPDMMALLCLIGGVVREAAELNLLMQLMLIGTMCRPMAHAIDAWLLTEERYAHLEFEESEGSDEDGWGGEDEVRSGWIASYGQVEVWRHVTRFGLAVLIPVQCVGMIREPEPAVDGRLWTLAWSAPLRVDRIKPPF